MSDNLNKTQDNTNIAKQLFTIRDLIRWAITEFNKAEVNYGQGTDNAWDEAVYLILHTLNLPLDTLDPFIDARLLEDERLVCINIIQQRIQTKTPAAYLTGEAWLQGFKFKIDERAIIPRSPIAELLIESFDPWIDEPGNITNILDLCTGSACLAILAAHVFENSVVDAVDISEQTLDLASENIQLYDLTDRVNLIKSDLFTNLATEHKYDLIICNPPYVNSDSMANLPTEFLHEPNRALAGGADGMDLVRNILKQAADFLNPNGILVLEIGHEKDHFVAAFADLDPIWLSTQAASEQILLLTKEQLDQ